MPTPVAAPRVAQVAPVPVMFRQLAKGPDADLFAQSAADSFHLLVSALGAPSPVRAFAAAYQLAQLTDIGASTSRRVVVTHTLMTLIQNPQTPTFVREMAVTTCIRLGSFSVASPMVTVMMDPATPQHLRHTIATVLFELPLLPAHVLSVLADGLRDVHSPETRQVVVNSIPNTLEVARVLLMPLVEQALLKPSHDTQYIGKLMQFLQIPGLRETPEMRAVDQLLRRTIQLESVDAQPEMRTAIGVAGAVVAVDVLREKIEETRHQDWVTPLLGTMIHTLVQIGAPAVPALAHIWAVGGLDVSLFFKSDDRRIELAPALAALLQNEDGSIRQFGIDHLSLMAEKTTFSNIGSGAAGRLKAARLAAASAMAHYIDSPYDDVRAAAQKSFEKSSLGVLESLINDLSLIPAAANLFEPLGDIEGHAQKRERAYQTLVALGRPALWILATLRDAIDTHAETRSWAVRAIDAIAPQVIDAVMADWQKDSKKTYMVTALNTRCEVDALSQYTLPQLLQTLHSDDPKLADYAVVTLAEMGGTAMLEVAQLLGHDNVQVRDRAHAILNHAGGNAVYEMNRGFELSRK